MIMRFIFILNIIFCISISCINLAHAAPTIVKLEHLTFEIPSNWVKDLETENDIKSYLRENHVENILGIKIYALNDDIPDAGVFYCSYEILDNIFDLYMAEIQNNRQRNVHQELVSRLDEGLQQEVKNGNIIKITYEDSTFSEMKNALVINTPYSIRFIDNSKKIVLATTVVTGNYSYAINISYLDGNAKAKAEALKIISSMKYDYRGASATPSDKYLEILKQWGLIVAIVCFLILGLITFILKKRKSLK